VEITLKLLPILAAMRVFIAPAHATDTTITTSDPARAEIVNSDVAHFWTAFDDAAKLPMADRAGVYAREYFDRASQGLKDYAAARHVTPATLSAYVEQNRDYYAKIRPGIGRVVGQKPVIVAAFKRLKAILPDIRFPAHIYFVVGPQKGAGMNSVNGIIFAADVFATPTGTPYSYTKVSPDYVPFSMVHETIHFNQTYQTTDSSTLLQQAVSEGTADFIASLVLPQPDVRQMTDRWQYGCAHEAELAARFSREQEKKDLGPWMFNHTPDTGWPPDMGYWFGYRIDQAFYARSRDKRAALHDMLSVTDFRAFLKASGYSGKASACSPERPH
jgi:hypothetical protein